MLKLIIFVPDVTFFPYVQDPMRALSKLKHNGYKWRYYNNDESFFSLKDNENVIYEVKLIEPEFMEDRPNMLRKHDKQIAEIYKKALKIRSNVLAIYSGNHTSWFDAELNRYKREDNGTYSIILKNHYYANMFFLVLIKI